MGSPLTTLISAACLLGLTQFARGQQAVTRPDQLGTHDQFQPVSADGMALAQTNAAIEQSRLYQQTTSPVAVGVDANGTAVADTQSSSSDDDSFGAQKILKAQEKIRSFVVTGGASLGYTSNVALTRRDTRNDIFAVVDAGIHWSPRLTESVQGTFGLRASIFRYDKTESLSFQNLGASAGVAWSPPGLRGVSVFGRYDFTELLNSDGDEILMDHTFTIGAQKAVSLGRSHGFAVGATAMFGFSDPSAAQRNQIGGFFSYRLQLTRHLESDFLYRPAVHFYTDSGRVDLNQIVAWSLRYHLTDWAELNATISYGVNRSERSVFDYNVLTTGAGVAVAIRF